MSESREAEAGGTTRQTRVEGTGRHLGRVHAGASSAPSALETKLKLKVNHLKSAVDRPSRRIFLGYSFTGGKHSRIRVPKQTTQKMKSKLRKLCRKGRGRNLRRFIAETLNPVLRGWTN